MFIRNALQVISRELDVGNFTYAPLWDAREHRIDMRLRANEPEHVRIERLDLDLDFEAGEQLQIEISAKFDPNALVAELCESGFDDTHLFTDHAGDFGLLLARGAP